MHPLDHKLIDSINRLYEILRSARLLAEVVPNSPQQTRTVDRIDAAMRDTIELSTLAKQGKLNRGTPTEST